MARVTDQDTEAGDPVENERDESDILGNQDETDLGEPDEDDALMGAGPTDKLSAAETDEFTRGELDVVEQMKRTGREIDFPNRANPPRV